MPKLNKSLGRKVKEFRLMQQMTQEQAAVLFGVSIATYIRIEQGRGCRDLTRAKIESRITKEVQAA